MSAAAPKTAWVLRLYVNGGSPNSISAIENVRRICDEDLAGPVHLDVIDVQTEPAMVIADEVIAAPTLIKELPEPLRQLVGDLSDAERVREALDLGPLRPAKG